MQPTHISRPSQTPDSKVPPQLWYNNLQSPIFMSEADLMNQLDKICYQNVIFPSDQKLLIRIVRQEPVKTVKTVNQLMKEKENECGAHLIRNESEFKFKKGQK
ncbi:Hypothetical_protein [Hexamita inflata]|uniref:Hypothetical_protein n=1 Tax=Hexamita inflata TaxID=28002 RepID=A0AA86TIW8_9EUKA|nr:Hypothetical protein HINF_LOCUS7649 [Hexamita inflata]